MKADYQILIVDDDESIRRMLTAVLEREGYQTVAARTARRDWRCFAARPPTSS